MFEISKKVKLENVFNGRDFGEWTVIRCDEEEMVLKNDQGVTWTVLRRGDHEDQWDKVGGGVFDTYFIQPVK